MLPAFVSPPSDNPVPSATRRTRQTLPSLTSPPLGRIPSDRRAVAVLGAVGGGIRADGPCGRLAVAAVIVAGAVVAGLLAWLISGSYDQTSS